MNEPLQAYEMYPINNIYGLLEVRPISSHVWQSLLSTACLLLCQLKFYAPFKANLNIILHK
jgi:hypothetical protein